MKVAKIHEKEKEWAERDQGWPNSRDSRRNVRNSAFSFTVKFASRRDRSDVKSSEAKVFTAKIKGRESSRSRAGIYYEVGRDFIYPDRKREEISTSRQTLSRGSATPKFRSVNVLTNDISRQCIVAMIRPCSEPSGKRVTVNRIDREREREKRRRTRSWKGGRAEGGGGGV